MSRSGNQKKLRFSSSSGFSVVEALIAAALLLMITIGVLPLFTRAMVDNVEGRRATRVSNMARSKVEELYQLPFNSAALTVPAGQNELETTELYSHNQEKWFDEQNFPGGESPEFARITRIRQFGISALSDNAEFDSGEVLPGGTQPAAVHIKEIEVTVETRSTAGNVGANKDVTLRVYKPF